MPNSLEKKLQAFSRIKGFVLGCFFGPKCRTLIALRDLGILYKRSGSYVVPWHYS